MKVPITALVRLDEVARGIATGRLRGRIELYPADRGQTIQVEGRTIPLELEPRATLAYQLEAGPVWETSGHDAGALAWKASRRSVLEVGDSFIKGG